MPSCWSFRSEIPAWNRSGSVTGLAAQVGGRCERSMEATQGLQLMLPAGTWSCHVGYGVDSVCGVLSCARIWSLGAGLWLAENQTEEENLSSTPSSISTMDIHTSRMEGKGGGREDGNGMFRTTPCHARVTHEKLTTFSPTAARRCSSLLVEPSCSSFHEESSNDMVTWGAYQGRARQP